MTSTRRSFVDDDRAYLQWLSANPDGFVLNTDRRPNSGYGALHRSTCRSISGTPARGRSWTADYAKHCAANSADLVTWIYATVGNEPSHCKHCNP